MPLTQEVETDVTILGQFPSENVMPDIDFTPTDLEVEITTTTTSNIATLKGYTDRAEFLRLNDWVEIHVNEEHVFTGMLKRATQDKEGEVTMELYDLFYDIQRVTSTYQTEDEIPYREALVEIIRNDIGEDFLVDSPIDAPPGSIYVAPASRLAGGNTMSKESWGSGKGGDSLINVMESLADKMVAALWSDKRGVIRVEPIPSTRVLEARHLVETDTGEGADSQTSEVLVESGSAAVGRSSAENYIYNKLTPFGRTATNVSLFGGVIPLAVQGTDGGILSKKATNRDALSKAIADNLDADKGNLTLVGSVDPQPWDGLTVPDDLDVQLPSSNEYTIKTIKHVIGTSDGWETEIELGADLVNMLERFEDDPDNIVVNELERLEDGREDITPIEITR